MVIQAIPTRRQKVQGLPGHRLVPTALYHTGDGWYALFRLRRLEGENVQTPFEHLAETVRRIDPRGRRSQALMQEVESRN